MEHGAFKLTGLADVSEPPGGWQPVFYVSTGPENGPPMLGSYSIEAGALIFRPRFPLAAGVRYHAVYRPRAGAATEAWFDGPTPAAAPQTRVIQVYPSAAVWPANQLRFYIYFSAPMRRGGVWSHLHLLDDTGRVVPLAFLEIDQELWDRSNQRLTVLFDPGRIKRGVAPDRDLGPPIAEGRRYTIAVDRELLDANLPVPWPTRFRKQFRGGAPVRSAIDPNDWRISPPPGTPSSQWRSTALAPWITRCWNTRSPSAPPQTPAQWRGSARSTERKPAGVSLQLENGPLAITS